MTDSTAGDRRIADRAHWAALGEAYRNRARSAAALTASGAAAIAAGFTLAPTAGELPGLVFVLGLFSAVALLFSTGFFVGASLHSSDKDVHPSEAENASKEIVRRIRELTSRGARISVGGVAFIVLAFIVLGVDRSQDDAQQVELTLTSTAQGRLRDLCPNLPQPFSARVDATSLRTAAPSALLRLEVDANECCQSSDRTVTNRAVWVPASAIVQVDAG